MPEAGRILPFRHREERLRPSPAESSQLARSYLETPASERTSDLVASSLSEPDSLLAICAELKARYDTDAASIWEEAPRLYAWIAQDERSLGLFDERDYFLGESALLAGQSARLLGKREEAELWFDRAEAGFRHTVNPAPLLANVAYARLALYFDRRQYNRVFELLPSLTASFLKLGMDRERLKCGFLEAMALKESAKAEEALFRLSKMLSDPGLATEPGLEALVLVHYAELLSATGKHAEAVSYLKSVGSRDLAKRQPLVAAQLKAAMAEALRQQGLLSQAVEAYRAAVDEYAAAGMDSLAAYVRVVLAETLIALSRHREAEWQIAAALPTIEEQRMVPEGFAAVALLRESVRRRKADPNAVRDLREHLQGKS